MKRTLRIAALLVVAVALLGAGCARQPDAKHSAKILKKYFIKYGKKYPQTAYASKVDTVEILGQQEIHKGLVAVESFLTLKDGTVQRVHATIKDTPLGWRFSSWENSTNL